MSCHRVPLVLHKSEWERLKKQGSQQPPKTEAEAVISRKEYYKALNEQSKKWINAWPDSAEGVKDKLNEQRKKQHKEDLAMLDEFRNRRLHENKQEAVRKAKQLIFDGSCYGKQLISAIRESMTLEERDAQIKFKKEIKQKEAEIEKKKEYSNCPFIPLNVEEIENGKKLAAMEYVKFNQEQERLNKENVSKLKIEQNACEIVDKDMIKQFQEAKAKKKVEIKLLVKQGIEEYKAIQKEVEKHRKISEERDNALVEIYKKEQDRIKCKVNAVLKKVIDDNRHGDRPKKIYEMIDNLQKAEKKRYDDFVEKGIKEHDERKAMQKNREIEMENKKRANLCKTSQENKISGENNKLYLKYTAPVNKCVCDVQTLFLKSDQDKPFKKIDKVEKKIEEDKSAIRKDGENSKQARAHDKEDKLTFLKPRNKLVEALKRREMETSGWTGADAADKYFAQQAMAAIHESKHKQFAKKVVGVYMKMNNVGPNKLEITK